VESNVTESRSTGDSSPAPAGQSGLAGAGRPGGRGLGWLNQPVVLLLVVALTYGCFLYYWLEVRHLDPSRFIFVGERNLVAGQPTPPNLVIDPRSWGYDGQYYYRLALDPFTNKERDFGIWLHPPAYRHQRILLPLVVWLVTFGRAAAVPTAIIAVNYCAICAIGYLAGVYARAAGRHALWGLTIAAYPGFLFSLARDTTEPLEIALLLGALIALRRQRYPLATCLLTLAVLARETALYAVAGIGLVVLMQVIAQLQRDTVDRRWVAWLTGAPTAILRTSPLRWYCVVVPGLVYIGWSLLLKLNWGTFPFEVNGSVLGTPFSAFIRLLIKASVLATSLDRHFFVDLLFFIGFTACVALATTSRRVPAYERIGWLIYLALTVSLGAAVWVENWAYYRALSDFYVLGAVVLVGAEGRLTGHLRMIVLPAVAILFYFSLQWVMIN